MMYISKDDIFSKNILIKKLIHLKFYNLITVPKIIHPEEIFSMKDSIQ